MVRSRFFTFCFGEVVRVFGGILFVFGCVRGCRRGLEFGDMVSGGRGRELSFLGKCS